jgi:hypothetical protein
MDPYGPPLPPTEPAMSLLARSCRSGMSAVWSLPRVNRTWRGQPNSVEIDPDVWSGRALQEDFVELAAAVLHQCIRPLIGACGAPGHHGYQRACVLVNGQASTGHLGHQYSHALGKPNLHLVSSSRKPRLAVDWVTSSLAPHIAQFLCSSQGPFLRPGPQNVDRVARRGGQGRPSRLACGWLRRCRAAP